MADLEAIRLLTEGVTAWNRKRPSPQIPVDLTHIEVRNARLPGVDLRNVDLNGVVLNNVDLREARLTGAQLNGVTADDVLLDKADLTAAGLKGSDLKWVCLRETWATTHMTLVWTLAVSASVTSTQIPTHGGTPAGVRRGPPDTGRRTSRDC